MPFKIRTLWFAVHSCCRYNNNNKKTNSSKLPCCLRLFFDQRIHFRCKAQAKHLEVFNLWRLLWLTQCIKCLLLRQENELSNCSSLQKGRAEEEGQRRGCSPAASQAACLSPGPLKVTNTAELSSTDKYTAPRSWRIRISDCFPHSDPSLTYQLLLMQLWWHLEPHRTIFLCLFSPPPASVFLCFYSGPSIHASAS